MNPIKLITHPLLAATVALALAAAWAHSFNSANNAAREAAEQVKPWMALAREQMTAVGACEDVARSQAHAKYPNPAESGDAEIEARSLAFACSSGYLLSQPEISASVATQVLGYAAGVGLRMAAHGDAMAPPPNLEPLYARAAKDARLATQDGEAADSALLAACQGLLAASACSAGGLTPDRPERRLGDSMRDFEVDVHAQYWSAAHPKEELAYTQASKDDPEGRRSPAYAYARQKALKSSKV